MTNRPWLGAYPQGVPADIDAAQYGSLVQLMEESFQKYAGRTAYSFMGKELSFAQTDALSRTFGEPRVTWQRASAAISWQTAGANGATDRENVVLGTLAATSSGNVAIVSTEGMNCRCAVRPSKALT